MKALLLLLAVAAPWVDKPETVMVTCYAKRGSEAALQRVLARHWTTVRDLKLVLDAPHLTLRGVEAGGRTYFVEIFTWRDESIPDNAPAAVRAIWDEMNQLAEKVDIAEMEIIGSPAGRAAAGAPAARAPAR
jgi:hypothetical protein